MKHLKSFENNTQIDPEIGDYVICYEEIDSRIDDDGLAHFLSNNIGKIVRINSLPSIRYSVEYENIPTKLDTWFHDIKLNCREMRESEIIHWTKNKKELETIITANKYNL